ncbi:MAG: PilZ domain-containing protein [Nitrospinae bacterium]|nr:PilZ domain-containing protein [Nitrospinota bacterium]
MGKDKRSFPRSLVEYPVEIRSEGQILPGKIIDLTVEAISLETGKPFQNGESFAVSLEASSDLQENELKCEVARCELTDSGYHRIVAKIRDVNDEFLMDALALVHGSGPKKDRRKFIFGRQEDGG